MAAGGPYAIELQPVEADPSDASVGCMGAERHSVPPVRRGPRHRRAGESLEPERSAAGGFCVPDADGRERERAVLLYNRERRPIADLTRASWRPAQDHAAKRSAAIGVLHDGRHARYVRHDRAESDREYLHAGDDDERLDEHSLSRHQYASGLSSGRGDPYGGQLRRDGTVRSADSVGRATRVVLVSPARAWHLGSGRAGWRFGSAYRGG